MNKFSAMGVVMFPWMYSYIKTYQILHCINSVHFYFKFCFTKDKNIKRKKKKAATAETLIQGADSLEKTLMLGGIGGRGKRGRQRMRWLDGITHVDGRE